MRCKSVCKKVIWGAIQWTLPAAGTYFQKSPPAGKPLDLSRLVYLFTLESQSSSPRRLPLSHRFCLVTRSHNSDERKSIQINSNGNRMAADGSGDEGRCDVIRRDDAAMEEANATAGLQRLWRKWFVQRSKVGGLHCLLAFFVGVYFEEVGPYEDILFAWFVSYLSSIQICGRTHFQCRQIRKWVSKNTVQ